MCALWISLGLLTVPQAAPTRQVLVGAHILDVERGVLVDDQALVVEGSRVIARVAADQAPGDAVEVRLDGGVLVPGLVDLHVHGLGSAATLEDLLAAGVTTVRSPGWRLWSLARGPTS